VVNLQESPETTLTFNLRRLLRKYEAGSLPQEKKTKLLNRIIDNSNSHDEGNRNISFRSNVLYLLSESHAYQSSHLKSLPSYIRILQIRGMTRWLSKNYVFDSHTDPYSIGRFRLLFILVTREREKACKLLKRVVLSTDDRFPGVEVVPNEVFTHPDTKFKCSGEVTYKISSEVSSKLRYSNLNKRDSGNLFANIILWNSQIALKMIKFENIVSNDLKIRKVIEAFPDFKAKLECSRLFQIHAHKHKDQTFDERLGESGEIFVHDQIQDAKVLNQRFVVSDEKWIWFDATCDPRIDFVAGHWQFVEQSHFNSDHIDIRIQGKYRNREFKEAIFLIGRADENWYHLLLDTLPRYLFMKDLPSDIPVLIRDDLPLTSKEFLQKLLDRTIIEISTTDQVHVETLHFLAARGTIFDSEPQEGRSLIKFSPKVFLELKNFILERMNEPHGFEIHKRIIFPRKAKYRNVINYRTLLRWANHFGYKEIDTNSEFFRNQFWLFNKAEKVISPGGALLANMLFMKPGSIVIVPISLNTKDLNLWGELGTACGLEVYELPGMPIKFGRTKLSRTHANYFIPVRRFKSLLRKLELKPSFFTDIK